jgi:phenylglyoxylate dehydrogenase epsilon subunit
MQSTHYLIVGASHAALAALHAIRHADADGAVTLVSKDDALPYSPTVLPYVVSGRSDPDGIALRDEGYFAAQGVRYLRGRGVTSIDSANSVAALSDGEAIAYRKLLLASGAAPYVPPIPGLSSVAFHVLRTLDDALGLRRALPAARRPVVLGAGLIGVHAAENLAGPDATVTLVERESQMLPAYFDAPAAALIESVFRDAGVTVRTGTTVVAVSPRDGDCSLALSDGSRLDCDLLLVGAGVVPVTGFLAGSGVALDRGVLVDDSMRTNVENIWAAGDVAQARDFFGEARVLNGILPDAVEQGRIAGMAMAEDPALKHYPGGVPINTCTFFGNQALSVGRDAAEGDEVFILSEPQRRRYRKIVLANNRLAGIFGINAAFDAGIMWELILRRVDLAPLRERFLADPQSAARVLMSKTWR